MFSRSSKCPFKMSLTYCCLFVQLWSLKKNKLVPPILHEIESILLCFFYNMLSKMAICEILSKSFCAIIRVRWKIVFIYIDISYCISVPSVDDDRSLNYHYYIYHSNLRLCVVFTESVVINKEKFQMYLHYLLLCRALLLYCNTIYGGNPNFI